MALIFRAFLDCVVRIHSSLYKTLPAQSGRCINIVLARCLSTDNDSMQEEVSPPAAVRALNLVDAVWPAEEQPQPEVHLSPFHCHPPPELLPQAWKQFKAGY